MTDVYGLIVRSLHIVCGISWAGAAFALAGFVEPAVFRMGPDGGKFMQRLMGEGRFGMYMALTSLVTAVTGILLLELTSGGGLRTWTLSPYGRTILVGSVFGLVGFVWGFAINAPTAAKLARLAGEMQAGGPPSEDLLRETARLKHRLHLGGVVSAVLLGASALAMAAAKHM